jgi:hypothetical protein
VGSETNKQRESFGRQQVALGLWHRQERPVHPFVGNIRSESTQKADVVSKEFIDSLGRKSTSYHMSETGQRNASDRPYDNGYFLDLVQQVDRLAAQIATAREVEVSSEEIEDTN